MPLIIFRNSFSPFNFGKVIVFRILIEVLLIAYIPLAIKYKEFRPFSIFQIPNYIFWALTFFTISYAISTFLGVNWHQSFWGYWERMGGLFTWLHYYAFLIILVSVFKTKEDWLAIFWLSVTVAVVSTFYGFFQKFSVDTVLGASTRLRIFGTLGNPAAFAGYLLFNFYFALYLLGQYSSKKIRVCLIGVIVLFLAAILMTAVRGAALSLVVSVLAYLFLERKHIFKWADKKPFFSLTILLIVAVFLLSPYLSKFSYFERLTNFSISQPTVQQRILVWKIAWQGIKEKPFFGWGPENFSSVFSSHYDSKISRFGDEIFDRAHNILLDIGTTQGLIGLLAWLFLIICLFRSFLKSKNHLFCSLIVAYLIHNFFFFDLFSSYLMFFILVGFGIYLTNNKVADGSLIPKIIDIASQHRLAMSGAIIIFIALFGILIFYANIKPALANFYSTRGYVLLYQGNSDRAFDYFDKAFSNAAWSDKDIYKKFSESFIDLIFRNRQFLKKDENQTYFKRLISGLKKEVEKSPLEYSSYRYLYKSYRAEYLLVESSPEKVLRSEELLKQGIKTLPIALPLYYELADFYIENKRYDDAVHTMENINRLAKDLPVAQFKLGAAYLLKNLNIRNKDKLEFEKGLDLIFKSMDAGYYPAEEINFLGKALEQSKRYSYLINFYLKLSEKTPSYFVHVSYTYLLLGDRKNSESFADRALALDYNQIGSQKLRLLADIYQALGDNKKRSEALLKSAP